MKPRCIFIQENAACSAGLSISLRSLTVVLTTSTQNEKPNPHGFGTPSPLNKSKIKRIRTMNEAAVRLHSGERGLFSWVVNQPAFSHGGSHHLPPCKTKPNPHGLGFVLHGGRWIRTTEGGASRFTVCPLWPLGNSPWSW